MLDRQVADAGTVGGVDGDEGRDDRARVAGPAQHHHDRDLGVLAGIDHDTGERGVIAGGLQIDHHRLFGDAVARDPYDHAVGAEGGAGGGEDVGVVGNGIPGDRLLEVGDPLQRDGPARGEGGHVPVDDGGAGLALGERGQERSGLEGGAGTVGERGGGEIGVEVDVPPLLLGAGRHVQFLVDVERRPHPLGTGRRQRGGEAFEGVSIERGHVWCLSGMTRGDRIRTIPVGEIGRGSRVDATGGRPGSLRHP